MSQKSLKTLKLWCAMHQRSSCNWPSTNISSSISNTWKGPDGPDYHSWIQWCLAASGGCDLRGRLNHPVKWCRICKWNYVMKLYQDWRKVSTICWWTDEIKIYSSGALLVFQQGLSVVWCNSAADGLEDRSTVPPAGIIHWNSTGLAGGSEAAAQGVGWWSFNWLGGESTVTADGVMRRCFRGRGHKVTEVSLSGKLSWTSSDVTAISEAAILAFASRASGR